MTRKILMVAFHFPPLFGSSGIQRTLSFVDALHRSADFQPVVLSASRSAYEVSSDSQLGDLPPDLQVRRALALDSARHLSIGGKYLEFTSQPDRWVSWYPFAVLAGLRLIRRYSPAAIWSTYPIATAHMIAATLQKLSGLPWISDFRDPMVEFDPVEQQWHPPNTRLRNMRSRIERRCVERSSKLVFCTEGARSICLERYSGLELEHTAIVTNGYSERTFAEIEGPPATEPHNSVLTIVHSGTLYPGSDRDPRPFFEALHGLRMAGFMDAHPMRIVLRASAFDDVYRSSIERLQLASIVEFAPAVPYRDALQEMLTADGLLLFQGHTSNPAIPAKLYEYLRAKTPIFAMVDNAGETAGLLRRFGIRSLAPLDDAEAIQSAFRSFIDNGRLRARVDYDYGLLRSVSREAQAEVFINLVDRLTTP